jgi:predicted acetyltransferase
MRLVRPSRVHLASYVAALERGWSPDNVRPAETAREELQQIAADAEAFLCSMEDRKATGPPIVLPDGSRVARLPGWRRWMWDGEFAGSIGFRWQPGTSALPAHCLGHVGYAVVPWKRGQGYATAALGMILPEARSEGLEYLEVTTDPDNVASQRVIQANGGTLVERFTKLPQYGSKPGLTYRIALTGLPAEERHA